MDHIAISEEIWRIEHFCMILSKNREKTEKPLCILVFLPVGHPRKRCIPGPVWAIRDREESLFDALRKAKASM